MVGRFGSASARGERDAADAGYHSGAGGAGEHGIDVGQGADRGGLAGGGGELAGGDHLGQHRPGGEFGPVLIQQGAGGGGGDGPLGGGAGAGEDGGGVRGPDEDGGAACAGGQGAGPDR